MVAGDRYGNSLVVRRVTRQDKCCAINAPTNVKPEGGGGGRAAHRNLTMAYIPRVGILIRHHAFDLSILYSRREVNHLFLLILTINFARGGDFDNFF